ncbi:MAG: phosphoserine phosphatase SerB [Proteobacteria bacterium]|nr:phosphoserine phosphatase SerB [Pseudomonadota bacterium]
MMMSETVLTVVADNTGAASIRNVADGAVDILTENGATCEPLVWLKEGIACDVIFSGLGRKTSEAILDDQGLLSSVDYCIQAATNRRKKLFLADMDSTIITVECIDELADFAGLKAEVSAITEQAMNGEIEFSDAFRARVAMLKGLRREVLQQVFEERVTLTPGAQTLVQTMRANGTYSALVSGGFTFFTSLVREWVGFDMDMSNELQFQGDELTGIALEPILNSAAKLNTLERLLSEKSIDHTESLAVGDGANDIPMIEAAGLGVAFKAKKKAADAADARIHYGDLTTLLYFQGYRAEEFIGA